MKQIQIYSAVLGRAPYLVIEPQLKNNIWVAFFPKIDAGFFKRLMAEGCDQNIYVSAGLSNYQMKPPVDLPYKPQLHIELIAQTAGQITGGESGKEDVVSYILQMVANYIIDNSIFIEPGHTFDFGEKITTNSEMSGYLFAVPEGLNIKRICKANTKCETLVGLVPLSRKELEFARSKGVKELIDEFQSKGVPPLFDPFRKCMF
jgi:Suppressor of fused protein (SUFU)